MIPGVPEIRRPPAVAYTIVADNIGDARYFIAPPPAAGVRLEITGTDGVKTQWDMGQDQAVRIAVILQRDPRIRAVTATYFDERNRSE